MKLKKYCIFMCVLITCIVFTNDLIGQDYLSKLKKGAVEWTENRTAFSKTFLNPDGTNTAVISVIPIHFVDDDGMWREIESRDGIPVLFFDGIMIWFDEPTKTEPGVGYKGFYEEFVVVRSYIEWSTESIDDDATINSAEFTFNITNGNTTAKSFGWYETPQISSFKEFIDVSNSWGSSNRYGAFIESSEESWTQTFQCESFTSDLESQLSEDYISAGFMNNNETSTSNYLEFEDENGGDNPLLIVDYTLPSGTPTVLYFQNETITGQEPPFEATQQIFAGREVTEELPYGDVIITNTANVTFRAGAEIMLEPGVYIDEGALFHAYIEPFDQMKTSHSTSQNLSEANNSEETKNLMFQGQNIATFFESCISIYPNPNAGIFNINVLKSVKEPFNIEIRNMMGVIVFKNDIIGEKPCKVDISNHPSGIYFIQLSLGNELFIEKIIKQY